MDLKDISQQEFEHIEAYLTQELSEKERSAFENRLNSETALASKVALVKTLLTGIETQAMKEQLDVFHNQMLNDTNNDPSHQPKVKFLYRKRIAVAVAIIIATGLLWISRGNANQRLYTEYFSPDPGLPTTMGNSDNYEFYKAMVAYKQGNYDEAITTWKDQLKTKTQNDTLHYFIGSALLAKKQEGKSVPYLLEVTTQHQSVFKNEAYYYLGLAYLKANNIEDATNALKNSDLKDAKDLLKKLN